jgi:hypothetical protein
MEQEPLDEELIKAQAKLARAQEQLLSARLEHARLLQEKMRLNRLEMRIDAAENLSFVERLKLLKEIFFPPKST